MKQTKKKPRAANTGQRENDDIGYLQDNQIITVNQVETHSQTGKATKHRQSGSASLIQTDKVAFRITTIGREVRL